jgi:hypothetical protein
MKDKLMANAVSNNRADVFCLTFGILWEHGFL